MRSLQGYVEELQARIAELEAENQRLREAAQDAIKQADADHHYGLAMLLRKAMSQTAAAPHEGR